MMLKLLFSSSVLKEAPVEPEGTRMPHAQPNQQQKRAEQRLGSSEVAARMDPSLHADTAMAEHSPTVPADQQVRKRIL